MSARGRGATLPRVVAAEWTKLTSLRSTWWAALASVAVSAALTYLSANASSGDPGYDPLGDLTAGLLLTQLGPLVLGVLAGTGEFSTGGFRTTFVAVPRRWPVLAAQAAAVAGFALPVAVASVVAAVLAVLPAASSRDLPVNLTEGSTPQELAGTVLFLTGLSLFGLAVGALVRRAVPALVTVIGLTLVLPVVLTLAVEPTGTTFAEGVTPQEAAVNTITTLLPSGAGGLLVTPSDALTVPGAPDLGAVGGGLVLAAWALVPLVAAALRLRLKDVK
ncbi:MULTISPECIES: hypothetical protein [Streptomyces]|uniref:hypothetical protein n=1 Tax=Streptomyces TaxID=1883 RepID=UPI00140E964B|nr:MULTISPECIES: hypothetical protein [Streptomyces]MDH6223587.1 ABC-2 type transport system permease protein [Streptomyces sp. MJP52]